jgi:hypothetical protein
VQPAATESDLLYAPAPVEQNPARGARHYQLRPSPAARTIAPEELEPLRRLQEVRASSDLISQFGPYKGSTLAQVAMCNPEYIRQLMRGAQRPEVRAAAGQAELSGVVPSGSTRSKVTACGGRGLARYATAVLCFVRAIAALSNRGRRRVVSRRDDL